MLTGAKTSLDAAAPYLRAPNSVERLLGCFVVASAPALLVGLWAMGGQIGNDPDAVARLSVGLSYFLPLLAVALGACVFWNLAFARLRRRPFDPGWLMTGWLYALLLPATTPLPLAALGISFGVVIGKHVFGGTGRYIVSPAALGVIFLTFAYPESLAGEQAAPQLFSRFEVAAFGAPSALACLLGAGFLVFTGAASARIMLGGVAGAILAAVLLDVSASGDAAWQIPWYRHLALGSFAFGLAFIATDPTTLALTPLGRWLQGGLIGLLTVLIRVVNPAHPEGILFAIVLGSLFTPLIDHIVVNAQMARRRHRLRQP